MQEYVTDKRADREARLIQVAETLRQRLHQADLQVVDVSSRPKHLYSIYHQDGNANKKIFTKSMMWRQCG